MSTPRPKDATLVELRTDALTFRTRDCVLPGTVVDLVLRLEGQPLALSTPVEACLVMEKERGAYVYHCRLDLTALASSDRQILGLFISRGRGSPVLAVPGSK